MLSRIDVDGRLRRGGGGAQFGREGNGQPERRGPPPPRPAPSVWSSGWCSKGSSSVLPAGGQGQAVRSSWWERGQQFGPPGEQARSTRPATSAASAGRTGWIRSAVGQGNQQFGPPPGGQGRQFGPPPGRGQQFGPPGGEQQGSTRPATSAAASGWTGWIRVRGAKATSGLVRRRAVRAGSSGLRRDVGNSLGQVVSSRVNAAGDPRRLRRADRVDSVRRGQGKRAVWTSAGSRSAAWAAWGPARAAVCVRGRPGVDGDRSGVAKTALVVKAGTGTAAVTANVTTGRRRASRSRASLKLMNRAIE